MRLPSIQCPKCKLRMYVREKCPKCGTVLQKPDPLDILRCRIRELEAAVATAGMTCAKCGGPLPRGEARDNYYRAALVAGKYHLDKSAKIAGISRTQMWRLRSRLIHGKVVR